MANVSRTSTAPSTAWAGWLIFSGTMLALIGGFHAMAGLVAIFDDGYYLVTRTEMLVSVDYTTWGWIHLVLGLVALATGFGLMAAQMWARVTGIVIAAVSALTNIAFMAANPIWASIIIAFDVILIYAIAVHGREAREAFDA